VVIALFFYYSTILLIVFSTALFLNKKSESVYNDFDCDIIKAIKWVNFFEMRIQENGTK
jgi:hypothetical protein